MNYRELGKSGIYVSEIGLGCEGFLGLSQDEYIKCFDYLEEQGINCIDMYSPNPEFRKNVGAALKGRRDKFVLQMHIGTIWENGQYLRTRDLGKCIYSFEQQLKLTGTDHAEICLIHYCDKDEDWRKIRDGGILEYLQNLRSKGIVKAIGISSHNPVTSMKAITEGQLDAIMFSVNPCYDIMPAEEDIENIYLHESYQKIHINMDPERERLYEFCQRNGIGITVMKALGAGDLLSKTNSLAGIALTPLQCIHYALSRPGVATVLAGCRTIDEIRECATYETSSDEEKDYVSALLQMKQISWKGRCMYCGHCAPCPKRISVADVTKLLNLALAQDNLPETVREHYKILSAHAGDCIGCKICESRCPFGVTVTENMAKAKAIFGY